MRALTVSIFAVLIFSSTLLSADIKCADFRFQRPLRAYPEHECIVKFKTDIDELTLQKLEQRFNFHVLAWFRYGKFFRVSVPSTTTAEAFAEKLKQSPFVLYAHPDYYMRALAAPADPLFQYQWNLGDSQNGGIQYGAAQIRLQDSSETGVIVAIIDGGVAFENYAIYRKAPELSGTTFLDGFDFVNHDTHPNDDLGHGTHLATIIAGETNNGSGAAGIAPGVTLLPVKVLDSTGIGRTSDVAEGIIYAVIQGASILNISLGGPDSPTLFEALRFASGSGVVSICAAGNKSQTSTDSMFYPAAYNDFCLAVGAHGLNAIPVPYALENGYIDCSAPGGINGVDFNEDGIKDGIIQQTFLFDPAAFMYYSGEGTSYAASHVSAVAALLKASGVNGVDKIRQAIERSCTDADPSGWDRKTGWGLLNAAGALNFFPAAGHDVVVSSVKAPQWCLTGEMIQFIVMLKNQGRYEMNVLVTLQDALSLQTIGTADCSIKPGETRKNILVWDTDKEATGPHCFVITAQAAGDEDFGDNIFHKEVTVLRDHRDIAITGVDLKKQSEENAMTAVVQLTDNGTYNEVVQVTLRNRAGSMLGFTTARVRAQSDIKLAIPFTVNRNAASNDSLQVSVQTSDEQESNLHNNSVLVPLGF